MNILHKLGLYRASEVNELIAKTAALTESVDGVIEEVKVNKECYKIAIHLYNAANEVEHAVKVISEYCANTTCTECGFVNARKGCKLAYTAPAWWNLLEVSK